MPRINRHRPFTILDAMVLVAAFASSFWISRTVQATRDSWTVRHLVKNNTQAKAIAYSALVPITIATLILRLCAPRPTRRRLLNQPGACAGLAAFVGLLAALADLGLRTLATRLAPGLSRGGQLRVPWLVLTRFEAGVVEFAGFGVVLAWTLLAASGRWRAEATWIDRLGRAVGTSWVFFWALNVVFNNP